MQRTVYTVRQVAGYIKTVLEEDLILNCVNVTGEIANFKNHPSGHLYFTLKDETAALRAVMFKGAAYRLNFAPANGIKVMITGRVSIYEKTGDCQLYADYMTKAGTGELFERFEALKRKLLEEGLFDDDRKRAIPQFVKCVAVATSKSGAAVRDIIQIIGRRNKTIKIIVAHAAVQGITAAAEIRDAIELINKWGKADCIIAGRGGGSYEDLQAFNEEIVARAIYASKIPVISAVGHETDYTIADFTADLRAPTPSAAAEIVSFDLDAYLLNIDAILAGLNKAVTAKLRNASERLSYLKPKSPAEYLYKHQIYIDSLQKRANELIINRLSSLKTRLSYAALTADNLSPLKTVSRGYALIEGNLGDVITSVNALPENIRIIMKDGAAKAKIIETEEHHGTKL